MVDARRGRIPPAVEYFVAEALPERQKGLKILHDMRSSPFILKEIHLQLLGQLPCSRIGMHVVSHWLRDFGLEQDLGQNQAKQEHPLAALFAGELQAALPVDRSVSAQELVDIANPIQPVPQVFRSMNTEEYNVILRRERKDVSVFKRDRL